MSSQNVVIFGNVNGYGLFILEKNLSYCQPVGNLISFIHHTVRSENWSIGIVN